MFALTLLPVLMLAEDPAFGEFFFLFVKFCKNLDHPVIERMNTETFRDLQSLKQNVQVVVLVKNASLGHRNLIT